MHAFSNKTQVYSEFQPLEEVIVGRAYHPEAFDYSEDKDLRNGLKKILTETEEDLQALVSLLEAEGVRVRRPEVPFKLGKDNKALTIELQHFAFQFPNHPLMPRDTAFVYRNSIVETFTKSHSRYFENWAYYNLFKSYFENGSEWCSLPMPPIRGNPPNYQSIDNQWLLYHAANMIKCGEHIIYSRPGHRDWSGKGTIAGLKWFKRHFHESKFIEAPCTGHIDGKICLVKPGLLVTWNKDFVPKELKSWMIIEAESNSKFPEHFKKIKKKRFYKEFVTEWLSEWIGYVDETVFDVNMFSVREDLIISVGKNPKVFKQLEQNGVNVIYWPFRHQYFWDGAIHCLTLDTKRSGNCENYL